MRKLPIIIGLVPVWRPDVLDLIWPVIRPGIDELTKTSIEEYEVLYLWQRVYSGMLQLYMVYLDLSGTATDETYQQVFVDKISKPQEDYIGFFMLDPFAGPKTVHVFSAYVIPEYRDRKVFDMGMRYIEKQVRRMGAKELTTRMSRSTLEAMKSYGFEEGGLNMRKKLT
jgi:hypothetical protein